MLDPLSAGVGASLALILREWIEHHMRVKEKQANCSHHDFEEVEVVMYGPHAEYVQLICRRCGYQEPKRED